MKKLFYVLLLSVFFACSNNTKKVELNDPFKSGDIVYMKLDTTKVIIKYNLGLFDEENFAYRISYKEGDKIINKFALSSELFKQN